MKPVNNSNSSNLHSRLLNSIVRAAFQLEASNGYTRVKSFFYDLLENQESRIRPYFDISMIVLVMSSIALFIYDINDEGGKLFTWFESFVILIFVIEYLLRFWIYNHSHRIIIEHYEHAEFIGMPMSLSSALKAMLSKKWEYVTSPLAIIDLLAILPSYRPLRILRIFLLFRLFKLLRYTRTINEFSKVLLEQRFEFYTLAIFLGFLVFASSTAIYVFEGDGSNPDISNFFDAIYWALVTISTVGYGDIIPTTTEGRIVTLMLIVSGIGVIAFATSIVVAAFTDKLGELRESRVYAELELLNEYVIICGYGRVGRVVADMLKRDGDNVLVIDNRYDRVNEAKQNDLLAIEGDAGSSQLLQSIESRRQASMVLCLTTDDVTNVYITLTARSIHKDVSIISRANQDETVKKLELAGADHVITPYEVVGLVASESIGQPVAFEAIYSILTGHKYFSIDTVNFPKVAGVAEICLGDIDFSSFKLTLLGVIAAPEISSGHKHEAYTLRKHQFIFNPDRSMTFTDGMTLVVFGHRFSIEHLRDRLALCKIQDGGLVL